MQSELLLHVDHGNQLDRDYIGSQERDLYKLPSGHKDRTNRTVDERKEVELFTGWRISKFGIFEFHSPRQHPGKSFHFLWFHQDSGRSDNMEDVPGASISHLDLFRGIIIAEMDI